MALNRSSLIRGETSPDAMLVLGDERDLEALLTHDAAGADFLGLAYLLGFMEVGIEQLRIFIQARGEAPPGPGPVLPVQPRRRIRGTPAEQLLLAHLCPTKAFLEAA